MYLKDYNSKAEKLDTSVFTELSSLSKKNNEVLPKQIIFPFKEKKIELQNIGPYLYKFYQLDTINQTVKLELEANLAGDIHYKEKIDNLFYYNEIYYLNGNMRSKNISSWLGFSINNAYKYDEKGNLIRTIDFDQGYGFNFDKVLNFCKNNDIELQANKMNKLTKATLENGKKVWNINYFNGKTNKIDFYQLDGETGEIIQKEIGKEKYGIKHY